MTLDLMNMSARPLLRRLASAASAVVWLAASSGCQRTHVREITVVARGMTFVLPDQPDAANPVVRLRAGERVRLVLANEAQGLVHDFAIPDWDIAIDAIPSGATASATFTVPAEPGQATYRCRPHAQMMNGLVQVTP
jgi:plastocyanin